MYALYSNNLERFFLIDKDLWLVLHTARLLSSKFTFTVCRLNGDLNINDSNCIFWSLKDTGMAKQDKQTPKLSMIDDKVEYIGEPLDIDFNIVAKHQKFCVFVFKVVKAAWLTDAVNDTTERSYFTSMLDENYFKNDVEDSGLSIGFLKCIDKILYLSSDETEIYNKLENLFNNPKSNLLSALAINKKTFYGFLEK